MDENAAEEEISGAAAAAAAGLAQWVTFESSPNVDHRHWRSLFVDGHKTFFQFSLSCCGLHIFKLNGHWQRLLELTLVSWL